MRLIDANALKDTIAELVIGGKTAISDAGVGNSWINGLHSAFRCIDNAPTVEYTFEEAFQKTVCENRLYCPNKRPQGEWVFVQYDANPNISNWHCSECRFIARSSIEHLLFCPNCGAKMKGNEDGHDNNLF